MRAWLKNPEPAGKSSSFLGCLGRQPERIDSRFLPSAWVGRRRPILRILYQSQVSVCMWLG